METILFTDTHFGVKNNSITWLNSQVEFIQKQLIPAIKRVREESGRVRVIHLGDVFDSRSTISTLVAATVRDIFAEIAKCADEFFIIGGNHDYYSPNSDSVDSINLLLNNLNINIITTDILEFESNLFVPWYQWFDQDHIQNIIDRKKIKNVFTHADIVTSPVNIKGVDVYSGHVHIPSFKKNLKNLGSCYALNFADANHERGYYILHDNGELRFFPNKFSIRFWRLYNDDIFDDKYLNLNPGDYIELYMTQNNMYNKKFIERIDKFTELYKNIWTIPQITSDNTSDVKFEGYNIEEITKCLIPENLKDKFEMVLKKTVK